MANDLPQITQKGNNFSFNNQLFSSRDAAAKAQTRWINTTGWKPAVQDTIKKAAANNVSADTIAKAAATTVQKAANLPQNQNAKAQETVKSLQNIAEIGKNTTDNANANNQDQQNTDQTNADNGTEGSTGVNELDPNVTANEPQEIDPQTGLPIQGSSDAGQGGAASQSNAANGGGGSSAPMSNGGGSSAGGGGVNGGTSTVGGVGAGNAIMVGSDSSIGDTIPNANAPITDQTAANAQGAVQDQSNINNIKQDKDLGLSNSPDSPFWNKFGNPAIEQETGIPGYMNERNKVIASQLMLGNPNMKSLSEAERKQLIIEDIVRRQGSALDPSIMDWYNNTASTINNLITRQIPPYTSNDFFGMMLKGQNVSEAMSENNKNPSYLHAKSRFDNLKTFSSMNVNELADSIKSGILNPGSVGWNDLINKGMGQILNEANAISNTNTKNNIVNKVLSEVFNFDTNTSLALQESGVLDFLGTGLEGALSLKIFQTMTEDQLPVIGAYLAADEDVQAAKKASRETEEALNKLGDEINAFSDDVKTKVVEKGGEATGDPFLESYIIEKTKPFIRKREALNGTYKNQIAKLEDATENAKLAFEIKEYNKSMKIKGYEFILNSINSQKQAQAAAEKQQYEMAKDERDFTYKVAKDQRDYELDLAKFRKSGGGGGSSSSSTANDIIQGIYNSSISSANIFNTKTLEKLGLSGYSRDGIVGALTNGVFSENLSNKSNTSEISTAVDAIKKTFKDDFKDNTDYLAYLNGVVGGPKTLNYLWANLPSVFPDDETPIADIVKGIQNAAGNTDLSKSEKIAPTLVDRYGRDTANSILDQLGLAKEKSRLGKKIQSVFK